MEALLGCEARAEAPPVGPLMVALDSDFLIDVLNDQVRATERLRQLAEANEPLCVTPVSAAEVLIGAHRMGGDGLDQAMEFLRTMAVLEFDLPSALAAARIGTELSGRGRPLSFADTLTAGIALRHSERLVTRDAAFARVRGLRVERY